MTLVPPDAAMDDRGRVTIRREFRPRLGRRFVQILTPHGLLLRPVPDHLEGATGLDALRASGEDEAAAEAGA